LAVTEETARQKESLQRSFAMLAEQRRSVYFYLDMPVPQAVIERALRVAMLAPNHHRTTPWRFFVFAGPARDRLANAYELAALRLGRDVSRARQRAYDAPVMIAVACLPALGKPKVKLKEEEFATAAAVEHLLLSLASEDVGSLLTTGDLAESDELLVVLGIQREQGRVMAVVNVGYRNIERPIAERLELDLGSFVHWMSS
jgi:nitroreductase